MKYALLCVSLLALLVTGCDTTLIIHCKDRIPWGVVRMEPHVEVKPKEDGDGSKGRKEIDEKIDEPAIIVYDIKADYPEGPVTGGYKVWINGQSVNPKNDENDYDTGEVYRFKIQKAGYNTLKGKFAIEEGTKTYPLTKMLISKHRTIKLNITDKRSGKAITPDKVLIDGQEIVDGSKVKPGEKTLEIRKKGYQSIVEDFVLEVGEDDRLISRKMQPAEVKLTFLFYDYSTGKKIKADRIYMDRKRTASVSYVKPGNYKLLVKKSGYKTYKKKVRIPDDPVYTIKAKLRKSIIKLDWKITGEYPKGEEFEPEVVKIDGKDVYKGNSISSGIHKVVIQHPGYEIYRKQIVVPDGVSRYVLKAELTTLPRLVVANISYDVPPSAEVARRLGPCRVQLYKLITGDKVLVKQGIKVKPEKYEVLITRRAYENVKQVVYIWPKGRPFEIKAMLQAKTRILKAKVRHDIAAPDYLKPYIVDFVSAKGVARTVKKNGRVKPGKQRYIVRKEGYKMVGGEKTAYIEPSEEPYELEEVELKAQSRQLSFNIVYNNVIQDAESITVDGEVYSYNKTYQPGKKYYIVAKFKKFKTVKKNITFEPGVGPHVVKLVLMPK